MNGLPYAVAVWASCAGRHELHPAAWNRLGAAKPEDMLCPYISSSRCATTTPATAAATATGSSWGLKAGGGAQPLPHCLHAPQRRVFAFEAFRDVRRLARVWRHLTMRAVCELQVPYQASGTTASHTKIILYLYPEILCCMYLRVFGQMSYLHIESQIPLPLQRRGGQPLCGHRSRALPARRHCAGNTQRHICSYVHICIELESN